MKQLKRPASNPKETRVLSEECAFVRDVARGIIKVGLLSDSQVCLDLSSEVQWSESDGAKDMSQ